MVNRDYHSIKVTCLSFNKGCLDATEKGYLDATQLGIYLPEGDVGEESGHVGTAEPHPYYLDVLQKGLLTHCELSWMIVIYPQIVEATFSITQSIRSISVSQVQYLFLDQWSFIGFAVSAVMVVVHACLRLLTFTDASFLGTDCQSFNFYDCTAWAKH